MLKGEIGLVQKNGVTLFLGNKTFVDSQLQLVEGWGRRNPFVNPRGIFALRFQLRAVISCFRI